MTEETEEQLREEIARLRATNGHLFIAINSLAQIVFAPSKAASLRGDEREAFRLEVLSLGQDLDRSMLAAQDLIWGGGVDDKG